MLTSDVTTIQLTLLDCIAHLEKQGYKVKLGKPFKINDQTKLDPRYWQPYNYTKINPIYFQPYDHDDKTVIPETIYLKNISYYINITKNKRTLFLALKLIFTKMQNNNSYDDFFEQDYRRKITAKLQPLNNNSPLLPADLQQIKFNIKEHMITNNQIPANDIFQLVINQDFLNNRKREPHGRLYQSKRH